MARFAQPNYVKVVFWGVPAMMVGLWLTNKTAPRTMVRSNKSTVLKSIGYSRPRFCFNRMPFPVFLCLLSMPFTIYSLPFAPILAYPFLVFKIPLTIVLSISVHLMSCMVA